MTSTLTLQKYQAASVVATLAKTVLLWFRPPSLHKNQRTEMSAFG